LTSVQTEVKVAVHQMQATTSMQEVSPLGRSAQQGSPGCRDWLTPREATPATPPAQECCINPPKVRLVGKLSKPRERHHGCPPVVSVGPLSCMGV